MIGVNDECHQYDFLYTVSKCYILLLHFILIFHTILCTAKRPCTIYSVKHHRRYRSQHSTSLEYILQVYIIYLYTYLVYNYYNVLSRHHYIWCTNFHFNLHSYLILSLSINLYFEYFFGKIRRVHRILF